MAIYGAGALTLPAPSRVTFELVEPTTEIRAADGNVVRIRAGRGYWRGSIEWPPGAAERVPSLRVQDQAWIPAGRERGLAGLAPSGSAVFGTIRAAEPGRWTFASAPSPPAGLLIAKPWVSAGTDGSIVRLESLNGLVAEVAPAATAMAGDVVRFRYGLLVRFTSAPSFVHRADWVNAVTYQWEQVL